MKFRKYLALGLLVCLLLSLLAVPVMAEEGPFAVNAKAALLIEMNTGNVLYSLDEDEQNYPASLTKIMTCYLALRYGKLDDILTVSATALEGLHESGSTANLVEGEEISLENLLYCMMISSANEACNVVAEYISGSQEAFVDLMNQTAQELGCTGTHFANPHGLHDENHYTTAHDLSLIVREALKNETFCTITNTPDYMVPPTNMSDARKLATTNQLISTAAYNSYKYSKAAGVKTGFTTPAGRCLVSTADNGNIRLLGIILGAETLWDEELGAYIQRSFPECINMFEYGFKQYKLVTLLSTLYPVAEIPVNQSARAQTVALAPTEEIRDVVPSDYNPEDVQLDIRLNAESADAPVEAGTVLGQVTVTYQGEVRGTRDLAAITTVVRSEITHQVTQTKNYVVGNWWKWLVGVLILLIFAIIALYIFLQIQRKKERRKRVEARRRVLEQRRRQEQWQDSWNDRRE